jgi:hypothetical protein
MRNGTISRTLGGRGKGGINFFRRGRFNYQQSDAWLPCRARHLIGGNVMTLSKQRRTGAVEQIESE